MKKVGLICIILVMALGSLGVSYAKWSTDLYMNASMTTAASATLTLNPFQDSYINEEAKTTNYGNATTLLEGKLNTYFMKALIQFNLSSLAGRTIDSATLRLYATAVNQDDIVDIYRLRRSWVEGEVTWNKSDISTNWGTAGAGNTATDYYSTSTFARYIDTVGQWYSWTVTSDVQAFANTPSTNFGWILYGRLCGNNRVTFASNQDNSSPAHPPELVVTYH